jgi:hypothetical protein
MIPGGPPISLLQPARCWFGYDSLSNLAKLVADDSARHSRARGFMARDSLLATIRTVDFRPAYLSMTMKVHRHRGCDEQFAGRWRATLVDRLMKPLGMMERQLSSKSYVW